MSRAGRGMLMIISMLQWSAPAGHMQNCQPDAAPNYPHEWPPNDIRSHGYP